MKQTPRGWGTVGQEEEEKFAANANEEKAGGSVTLWQTKLKGKSVDRDFQTQHSQRHAASGLQA